MNYILVEKELKKRGIAVFTPLEFQRIFKESYNNSKSFINRNVKRGLLMKLKNGLYALSSLNVPKFIIANKLYAPSYISFETTLSYYHIIPETVYTISSATTKATRKFEVQESIFLFHKIKKEFFFGYVPVKFGDMVVLIAEPEKALLDYLYFVVLKKKLFNDRLNIKNVSKIKLLKYAKFFKNNKLTRFIKGLYDK
jgi:predicted transcriptional regulator of viral defense system